MPIRTSPRDNFKCPPFARGAYCRMWCQEACRTSAALTITLCDLVACGEVVIKVVFAVESGMRLYLRVESQSRADCEPYGFRVQHLAYVLDGS